MSASIPQRFLLHEPESFLRLFRGERLPERIDLDEVELAQVWALVGIAALARRNGVPALDLQMTDATGAGRFARAIGLRDAIDGITGVSSGEPGRTYKVRRVTRIDEVEVAAREIAQMILPGAADEESQKSIRYVLVELMRNAIQHSGDRKGGVVAAQRMDAGHRSYPNAVIQVAVADAGIGVAEALHESYPDISDPEAALVKALEPHVSGTFGPGRTGTAYNAGMGLFFISEMAKLTVGRMLLATRGATLMLTGDPDGSSKHKLHMLPASFPGTLVAFELPLSEIVDHAALIEAITMRAKERTPQRDTTPWVRFGAPPKGVPVFLVSSVAEDIEAAAELSRGTLQSRIFARQSVALDFRNVSVCTQSFLHALLFEAIRLSWALQTPIYVENAQPAVATGVRLVDNYARGG